MANRSLGTLTLDLIAKTGQFTQGMSQAERSADKTARQLIKRKKEIEKEWSSLGKTLGGVFAGIGIASVMQKFIKNSIDAQNEQAQLNAVLKSTGQSAGYSADELNKMSAAMAGSSTFAAGDITNAQTRLLSYTGIVGQEVPRAMQAVLDMSARLGTELTMSAETIGKALDIPSKGMSALSKQGFKFTDEQKKLAEQLEATGRTAEAQGIVLDALEVAYKGAAEASRDTFGGAIKSLQNSLDDLMEGDDGSLAGAKDAINNLADTMRSDAVKQAFAAITIGLANIVSGTVTAITKLTEMGQGLGLVLGAAFNGKDTPQGRLEDKNERILTQIKMRKNANTPEQIAQRNAWEAELYKNREAIAAFNAMESNATAPTKKDTGFVGPLRPLPEVTDTKKGAKGDDGSALLRKQLDAQLGEIKRATNAQVDALEDRTRRVEFENEQGLLSVAAYYDALKSAADKTTQIQIAGYDAEIAALQKYISVAGKPEAKITAQEKINDLLYKRNKLQIDGAFSIEQLAYKERKAAEEIKKSVDEVTNKMLEMQGRLGELAGRTFDAQNAELIKELQRNGQSAAVADLQRLREKEVAQGRINELSQKYALINGDLSIQEERIALAQQIGATGEITALNQIGALRQDAIAQLETQLATYQAMAGVSLTAEQVQAVERLRLELDKLKATADPLKAKFDEIFQGSFGNAFGDFITGTKSAKDAFTDFANSVANQISRMAAQEISSNLFGGGKGGAGGFLADLFRGGGSGGGLGGLFGFAVGSSYIPRDQLAYVHKGESILTAEETRAGGAGGTTMVTNNFTLNEPASRQTQNQVASMAGMAIQRAQKRNG